MSANPDSVASQDQFHSRVPPAKPMTTSGHQLGQQAGNDTIPESHSETHTPGSAPAKHTHQPNPLHSTPGQALNPDAAQPQTEGRTAALDMLGAASGDVHGASTFARRPVEGQTQRELHGAHAAGKRKGEGSGLEGTVEGRVREAGADLPEGVERGVRGEGPGAEERVPASAGEVAAERRRA
ncbi:hypothetical protein B0I37DRAFT_435936 [Chaetomium sp. MPI-CAGE-AT-0009]|nr:hypothetical protein B0I37DRAFT_435936 [Chaetomium sp. MPI-CAGE-AT-0009]